MRDSRCFPSALCGAFSKSLNVQVTYGRWLIDGYPKVVLFDIGSGAWKLDTWKNELWSTSHIGIPWHDRESNDSVILGYMVAMFIQKVGDSVMSSTRQHYTKITVS